MVVRVTTSYAISAYHHCCEFEPRSRRGVQHYVINSVSALSQVGVFSGYSDFPTNICNKSNHHDIAEILLKVALNTIKQTKTEVNVHRLELLQMS